MTFAPPTLTHLREYLHTHAGIAYASLGIVGDAAHAAVGTSYHLGADQLKSGAYSKTTARDKAGLSNAASAIDIGKFGLANGSWASLREFSIWLVRHCRENGPGTRDIREVIYTPDGKNVWRYDRERGVDSQPRTGEADSSHLWHTHVSFYRDSEFREKTAIFDPFFFPPPPDTGTEEPVKSYPCPEKTSTVATIPTGTWLYVYSDFRSDPGNVQVSPGRDLPYLGKPDGVVAVAYDRSPDIPGASALFVKDAVTTKPAPVVNPPDAPKSYGIELKVGGKTVTVPNVTLP